MIELIIAVDSDDGEENFPDKTEPGFMIAFGPPGDPWGEMGAQRNGGPQAVYHRFIAHGTNPIPQGALIETAIVTFRSNSARSDQCDLRVFIEDVDDSAPFLEVDGAVSDRFPFPNGTHIAWLNVEAWTSSGKLPNPRTSQYITDRSG